MTTNPGSRPLVDDGWRPRSRRSSRRERWRERQEALAARFGVSPRAVLGLVLLTLAVLGVFAVRLVLAARAGAVSVPVAPAAVSPLDRSVSGPGLLEPSSASRSRDPSRPLAPPGSAVPAGSADPSGASNAAGIPEPIPSPGRVGPPGAAPAQVGVPAAGAGAVDPALGTSPGGSAAGGAGPGQGGGEVVVHVVGRVRRPGVVRLPQGSRVEQAVTAAGGARSDADLSRVNLARPLVDGEQVVVPRPGEPVAPADGAPRAVAGGTARSSGPGPGVDGQGGAPPVDINTATATELDTLPGVGPVLAQRIVDWRAQNGRFTSVDELSEVSGIGDAVLARLRPLVRL